MSDDENVTCEEEIKEIFVSLSKGMERGGREREREEEESRHVNSRSSRQKHSQNVNKKKRKKVGPEMGRRLQEQKKIKAATNFQTLPALLFIVHPSIPQPFVPFSPNFSLILPNHILNQTLSLTQYLPTLSHMKHITTSIPF